MATVLATRTTSPTQQALTSSSTVAAVSASPSRLLQGKALSTVSTVGVPNKKLSVLSRGALVHPVPVRTLIVDIPATTKVAHDLTPSQVTVEVLGTKGENRLHFLCQCKNQLSLLCAFIKHLPLT